MKKIKIYSRNVSNTEDITILLTDVRSRLIDRLKKIDEGSPKFDELVQQTKDRKKALDIYKENMRREIKFFIDASLRSYIINDLPFFRTLKSIPHKAPQWLIKKVEENPDYLEVNEVYQLELGHEEFVRELDAVCDYIVTVFTSNPFFKLKGKSFRKLVEAEQEFVSKLLNRKTDPLVEGKDYQVEIRDGKYAWVKIISQNGLLEEGKNMGHCVGGYWAQVKNHSLYVYSLRDSRNNPHCTISFISHLNKISEIKGKSNRGTPSKYWAHIKYFLDHMKESGPLNKWTNYQDLSTNGLYELEGEIYNTLEGVHIRGERKLINQISKDESLEFVADYPVLARNLNDISDEQKIEVLRSRYETCDFFNSLSGEVLRDTTYNVQALWNRKTSDYDLNFRAVKLGGAYNTVSNDYIDAVTQKVNRSYFTPNNRDSMLSLIFYLSMERVNSPISEGGRSILDGIESYIIEFDNPSMLPALGYLYKNDFFLSLSLIGLMPKLIESIKGADNDAIKRLNSKAPKDDFEASVITLINPDYIVNIKDQYSLDMVALRLMYNNEIIPTVSLSVKAKTTAYMLLQKDLFEDDEIIPEPVKFRRLLDKMVEGEDVSFPPQLLEEIKKNHKDVFDVVDFDLKVKSYLKNKTALSNKSLLETLYKTKSATSNIYKVPYDKRVLEVLDFRGIINYLKQIKDKKKIERFLLDGDFVNKKLDFRKDFLTVLNNSSQLGGLPGKIIEKYGAERYIELCNEFIDYYGHSESSLSGNLFDYGGSLFLAPLGSPIGKMVVDKLKAIPQRLPHSVIKYNKWFWLDKKESTYSRNPNHFNELIGHLRDMASKKTPVELGDDVILFLIGSLGKAHGMLSIYGKQFYKYCRTLESSNITTDIKNKIKDNIQKNVEDGNPLTKDMVLSAMILRMPLSLNAAIPLLGDIETSKLDDCRKTYKNYTGEDISGLMSYPKNVRTIFYIAPELLTEHFSLTEIAKLVIENEWNLYDSNYDFNHKLMSGVDISLKQQLIERLDTHRRGEYLIETNGITDKNCTKVPFNQIHLLSPYQRVMWYQKNKKIFSPTAAYYHMVNKSGEKFDEIKKLDTELAFTTYGGHKKTLDIVSIYRYGYTVDEWKKIVLNNRGSHKELAEIIMRSSLKDEEILILFNESNEALGKKYYPEVLEEDSEPELGYGRPKNVLVKGYPNLPGVTTRWLEIPYGNEAIHIRFIPEPFLVGIEEYILILAVVTDSGEHDIKKLGKFLYKYMRRVYKSASLFLHKDSYIKMFKSFPKGVVPMTGLSLKSKVYNIPIEWGLGDEVKAYDVF